MSGTDPDAEIRLGNARMEAGQAEAAIGHYRAAIRLDPCHAMARYNLGNAQLRLGRLPEAEASYRETLRLQPAAARALNNLGNALRGQSRLPEAADAYARAVALEPDSAGARTNLGATLIALRRPAEALPHLHAAMRLQPDYAEAANNLGGALLALDRLPEALAAFEQARAIDPDLTQAEFGAAMVLLAQGRFTEGWACYEARWRDPHFLADEPLREAPVWDGRLDPAGRRILLHAEQGLGDTLQFVRYAPLLRARGAHVLLQVQPPLRALCADLADEVVAAGETLPEHELRCPLMSLPRAFATTLPTIPANVPYLAAAPRRDGLGPGPNIGIVLSGAPDHPEDDLRSIPANAWWPLLRLPATFHLLQPAARPQDEAVLSVLPGLRRPKLTDFRETAGLAAALDLIVTVDSAVAHLAGALGRPVWVLVQHSADFRWLRDRDDSPWYPTLRLFRRGAAEDWAAVLRRVAAAADAAYVQPPSTTKA